GAARTTRRLARARRSVARAAGSGSGFAIGVLVCERQPAGTVGFRLVAEIVHADAEQSDRSAIDVGPLEQLDGTRNDLRFVAGRRRGVASRAGLEIAVSALDRA